MGLIKMIAISGVATLGGALIINWLKKQVEIFVGNGVDKLKAETNLIQDEHLRSIAKDVVRFVAKKMPDSEGSTKLRKAINIVQAYTPDIVLSDDKCEVLIESAYDQLKKELKTF